ncbi:MAG: glycosyltransferase family 2 protein [Patescibacteria group bacterium]|nr:glycosyltransferase family 2 protein [Patescibacteria group bacterium]
MKTLLVSFIYPIIKQYLRDFFISLNSQTIEEFDAIIFDDKFNENLKDYGYNGKILYNNDELNIFEVRKLVIDYSIEHNYDLLIFADADDVMAKDRVENIIKSYEVNISFFYNDLYLLSNRETDFFKGKLPSNIEALEKIKEYNYFGMSHTALNVKKEREYLKIMPTTDKMIAYDWFLYSYILSKGGCGKKVNTKTYYRIYSNSTAGYTNYLTDKKLRTGLKVKKYHYDFMKQFDDTYNDLLNKIIILEEKLNNPDFKDKYIKYINSKFSDSVFWWENIKTLDKLEKGALDD